MPAAEPRVNVRPRSRLHRLLSHPLLNLAVGGAVCVCALAELFEDVEKSGSLQAAHGVMLVGLLHGLRAVGDLAEGAHKVVHRGEGPG